MERTCVKTVVREIPNIRDCFSITEDGKKGSLPTKKVGCKVIVGILKLIAVTVRDERI